MLGDYAMINGQEIGVILDIVAMWERGARRLDDVRTEQGGLGLAAHGWMPSVFSVHAGVRDEEIHFENKSMCYLVLLDGDIIHWSISRPGRRGTIWVALGNVERRSYKHEHPFVLRTVRQMGNAISSQSIRF